MSAAAIERKPKLSKDQRNSFLAAQLGWTMDAFDYFLVVLVYADIGKEFGVSLERMDFLTTVNLLMKPVGALLFGVWGDHVGRTIPLMNDVIYYPTVRFLDALP